MACTSHTWIATTSDNYMRCSQCPAICKAKYGTPLQLVQPPKKKTFKRNVWNQAEYDILNAQHQPDYTDHEKAATDLRNYWK